MKDVIKAIILPVVLAGLGGYFTYTYNEARIKADYAETIHKYLPEIKSEDIVVAQVALEILRPILTAEQAKAISHVILVRQKKFIDQAIIKDSNTFISIDEITKLNQDDGSELAQYAKASKLTKEGSDLLADEQFKEAAKKLKESSQVHSDFKKSAQVAQIIDDLDVQSIESKSKTKILDSIAEQHPEIPSILKSKKIADRFQELQTKRKLAGPGKEVQEPQ